MIRIFGSAIRGATSGKAGRFFILTAVVLSGFSAAPHSPHATPPPGPAAPSSQSAPVVAFLVRHAERLDDSADSPLSDTGRARVERLRALLANVPFTHVYSTNLTRTRDTARPLADDNGVELVFYSPGELEMLAEAIRASPGHHLVSGHSNTTPRLAEALGGDPHGPIGEFEYDRLYIIVISPGQSPVTTLLRF